MTHAVEEKRYTLVCEPQRRMLFPIGQERVPIKLYTCKLLKADIVSSAGLSELGSSKAQLGLGHSYSRAKVKFNVHRVDNMIIQTIAILDQLDKDINTFSMRIR